MPEKVFPGLLPPTGFQAKQEQIFLCLQKSAAVRFSRTDIKGLTEAGKTASSFPEAKPGLNEKETKQ